LTNDLQLQEMLEPRRAEKKSVKLGKPRSEVTMERAFSGPVSLKAQFSGESSTGRRSG
jgi:hypothetical protein